LASYALTRIFVGLWPKQRAEVPETDLKKLSKAFDTPDDPILLMKGRSVKRGAEGAIALTYAHGEEVDWEKVSSSHGRPLSELWVFFEKAKKYAPGIVSIISPSAASSTSGRLYVDLKLLVNCFVSSSQLPIVSFSNLLNDDLAAPVRCSCKLCIAVSLVPPNIFTACR
jgi:hypothetical protein